MSITLTVRSTDLQIDDLTDLETAVPTVISLGDT
jgi:hypothetical protein